MFAYQVQSGNSHRFSPGELKLVQYYQFVYLKISFKDKIQVTYFLICLNVEIPGTHSAESGRQYIKCILNI